MRTNLKLTNILVLLLLLLVSCNKDDQSEDLNVEPESLAFDGEEIINQMPSALVNSTDENAQTVMGWVKSATDWSAFSSYFTPPEDAVKLKSSSVTYTWSISYQGSSLTYWWEFEEDATTNYWTLEIQWNDGPRAPFIEMWERKDGSSGQVKYSYQWALTQEDVDFNDIYWTYSYSKNSAGDYTFSWVYEGDTELYDNYLSYEVIVKADGSGSVHYYSMDNLLYMAEWDTDGNGYYEYYFGESSIKYSWTV